jgi:hypothetical protein
VQAEQVGLARLPDGTRLVRVGAALEGELAAWRYGGELYRRRRRWLWGAAGGVAAGGAALAVFPAVAAAGIGFGALNAVAYAGHAVAAVHQYQWRRRVVGRIPAAEAPGGEEVLLRRYHLFHATLGEEEGAPALHVREVREDRRVMRWEELPPGLEVTIRGERARRVLARAMMDYNARGATPADVASAVRLLEEAGSAAAYTQIAAGRGAAITRLSTYRARQGVTYTPRQILGTFRGEILPVQRYRSPFGDDKPRLQRPEALALEMALHEETERHALEGELAELEGAWREAEEIAAIADALPGSLDERVAALRARVLPGRRPGS